MAPYLSPSPRPSVIQGMIEDAVVALNNPKGSTTAEILKYLTTTQGIPGLKIKTALLKCCNSNQVMPVRSLTPRTRWFFGGGSDPDNSCCKTKKKPKKSALCGSKIKPRPKPKSSAPKIKRRATPKPKANAKSCGTKKKSGAKVGTKKKSGVKGETKKKSGVKVEFYAKAKNGKGSGKKLVSFTAKCTNAKGKPNCPKKDKAKNNCSTNPKPKPKKNC